MNAMTVLNLQSNGTEGCLTIPPLLTLRSEVTERMADEDSSTREIPLTRGMTATVDAADFAGLSSYRWQASKGGNTWYARRHARLSTGACTSISMHRQILGFPDAPTIDHRDGNGLNNRRENIRPATFSQNAANRVHYAKIAKCGYIGVFQRRVEYGGSFAASISFDGKHLHLGSFRRALDAALAYDEAARRLYGEFSRLNFPAVTDYADALSRREPPPNIPPPACNRGHDLAQWGSPKGKSGRVRCILCRRESHKRSYYAAK